MNSFLWWTGAVFWLLVIASGVIAVVAYAFARVKQAITQAILEIESRKNQ